MSKYRLFNSMQRYWVVNNLSNNKEDYINFIEAYIASVLNANKNALNSLVSQYENILKDFSVLSYIQHFGGPSPLLDFTKNRFVALYFGINESNTKTKKRKSNIDEYFSIYQIDWTHLQSRNEYLKSLQSFIVEQKKKSSEIESWTEYMLKESFMDTFSKRWISFKGISNYCGFGVISEKSTNKTTDNESLNFQFGLYNNLNIIAQEGLFVFNTYPLIPLEEVENKFHPPNSPIFQFNYEPFEFDIPLKYIKAYEINKSLIPHIKSLLKNKDITKDKLFPSSQKIVKESLKQVENSIVIEKENNLIKVFEENREKYKTKLIEEKQLQSLTPDEILVYKLEKLIERKIPKFTLEKLKNSRDIKIGYSTNKSRQLNGFIWRDGNTFDVHNIVSLRIVSKFEELVHLDMQGHDLSHCYFVENLTKLRFLNLGNNVIEDISPIKKLIALEDLFLHGNGVVDLSPISGLSKLINLDLNTNGYYNKIIDTTPLENLKNLKFLSLRNTNINSINPLNKLYNLERLFLNKTKIFDVSPLSNLTKLELLNLSNNQISNIEPLKKLIKLKTIALQNNKIKYLPIWLFTLKADLSWNDSMKYNTISLFNNPIEQPPMNILKQDIQTIMKWYKDESNKTPNP